ncbi:EAL domain-containing response regulator [Enterovibrio norvegicus]|uniref:EAL domain, c-di-GMP-specific phosphodiesterase class I (Or its enzymatically inactive variant) n=2 Tax=Enterovibrio norvegicus TaxID=188144 RepID=A0A1I5V3D1_9GAMM|nr:EAL domain-containing response regulator [Enterovibrio norvegicus]SFQ01971.1 EAL domain, c-di-GMP-specific phosphodiesterase class I (or its enzymatically inactive variant) [Enterovibrio norvegicus DSM 15893]
MGEDLDKEKWILVIDDTESMIIMIQSVLSQLGYNNVDSFAMPQMALDAVKQNPKKYDVVLTDLNMPVIDGMEVIRELGNLGFRGGVCIVSDLETRVVELAANIAQQQEVYLLGSIAKPICRDGLSRVLKRMGYVGRKKRFHLEKMTRDELVGHISRDSIVPYYQPKLNPISNCIESLEVVARIEVEENSETILPDNFIGTAIQHDLVDTITMQLAQKISIDMPALLTAFGSDVSISINLSPTQLSDLDIPKRLHQLFDAQNIDKHQIILEITEEHALKSAEQLESLNRLRIQGYGVSMDDFGTGFTNIQQLRSLPFTEVKIDRSLVHQIHNDPFSQAIVRSLATFSPAENFKLVAEGVEELEELEYLVTHYPNMLIQGFLICRPKPIEQLTQWHSRWCEQASADSA